MKLRLSAIQVETAPGGKPQRVRRQGRCFYVTGVLETWRWAGKWWQRTAPGIGRGGCTRTYFRVTLCDERMPGTSARTWEIFHEGDRWVLSREVD